MKLFAFDRDMTVDISEGPVPLEAVKELDKEHKVVAIGNPKLIDEAEIENGRDRGRETKREALRRLRRENPGFDEYIVVDDVNLETEGWKYYTPKEFLAFLEENIW